jgi:hypothetical protein
MNFSNDHNLSATSTQLLSWLAAFGGFKKIVLDHTILNDKIILKITENNPHLEVLELYGGQSDSSSIFDGLNSLFRKCAKLKIIQLRYFNQFTSEQHLELLNHTPTLETLDICECANFDEICMRDVVRLNPQLKSVSLRTTGDKTITKNILLDLFQAMGRTDIVVREY